MTWTRQILNVLLPSLPASQPTLNNINNVGRPMSEEIVLGSAVGAVAAGIIIAVAAAVQRQTIAEIRRTGPNIAWLT
jgi:hypothetical protein